jgi:nucleoid-associated protein YgaU
VIGPDPGSLLPGQILYIPILPTNIRPESGKEYVVLPNDYLFVIAQRAYGDGNRFREIYEANRDVIGPDLTVLVPGQRIRIP